MKRALLTLLAAIALPLSAAEVAGVKIDDKIRLGTSELALSGAGMRKRLFFQVYVIGLYVTDRKADLVAQPGPKRVAVHMLRDVGAAQFTEALVEGIRENHSDADFKALEPRIKELGAIMAEVKEAKKGMAITLDLAGGATQLGVDGRPAGKPIAGEDFYRALLRIWLGDKPVQDDLKKALLGAP
jgi:hypothetical protein